MKIGFILYGDPGQITGGFIYDRMIASYLRESGDAVEIVSLPWHSCWPGLIYNAYGDLQKRIEMLSVDLILEDELCHPSLFALNRRLRENLRLPIVAVVHHLRCCEERASWLNVFYGFFEKKFLNSVDGYVFNSQHTADTVTARICMEKPFIVAAPGGDRFRLTVEEKQIRDRAVKPGPLEILFVGSIIKRKGLHILISSLRFVPVENWRLTVVGSAENDKQYVRHIRRQIAVSGLQENISLTGEICDADLENIMARSHVLVVPSFIEGFGIVYLEGMSFGLPSIACEAGGAAEIVKHGINGYLVTYGDRGAISRHIDELAKNRLRLAEMSLAALKTYVRHDNWKDAGKRVGRFLHSFNGRHPR